MAGWTNRNLQRKDLQGQNSEKNARRRKTESLLNEKNDPSRPDLKQTGSSKSSGGSKVDKFKGREKHRVCVL